MTRTAPPGARRTRSARRARLDLVAAAAAVLLVVTAVLTGRHIEHTHGTLRVPWPPLYAHWLPHTGPGTPLALVVAALLVAHGPALAARLPWRGLLAGSWAAATAWILCLALVDGWHRGIAVRLTTRYEYLRVVDRFHDIPAALRDFTNHILIDSPDPWPAHTAGHPPAAPLTFVLLDRAGLGGGGWAGLWCVVVGATGAVAVLIAVRALAGEDLARGAAPFLVLAPGAVWMGASADAYFAAVAAWALALLTLAVTGQGDGRTAGVGRTTAPGRATDSVQAAGVARTAGTGRSTGVGPAAGVGRSTGVGRAAGVVRAAAAGLLFGLTCYLSYGLTLVAVIGAAVLLLGRRHLRGRPALPLSLLAGCAVVPTAFTLAGFDWWEAYHLLVTRYHQGAGGIRPYGYWVWANLACTVLVVGPATVAGLRRVVTRLRAGGDSDAPPGGRRFAVLVSAALLALLIADLSGMSKAETERIWLPFALWLLPACALLPRPRAWLAAQATLALLVNHLLLTGW